MQFKKVKRVLCDRGIQESEGEGSTAGELWQRFAGGDFALSLFVRVDIVNGAAADLIAIITIGLIPEKDEAAFH